jgi:hypothetical protein
MHCAKEKSRYHCGSGDTPMTCRGLRGVRPRAWVEPSATGPLVQTERDEWLLRPGSVRNIGQCVIGSGRAQKASSFPVAFWWCGKECALGVNDDIATNCACDSGRSGHDQPNVRLVTPFTRGLLFRFPCARHHQVSPFQLLSLSLSLLPDLAAATTAVDVVMARWIPSC